MSRWEGFDEFMAVADTGSFASAAVRLGVSSSHVSRQVVRLEQRLQTRLFNRTTRVVRLTEAGQTFLNHCRQLQDIYDEAQLAVQDLEHTPKGLLRITCSVAYGERFVAPVLVELMEENPDLRIELELTNQVRDIIHEGFDLAIRLGRVEDVRLVAVQIAPRNTYLCCSPGYVKKHGAPKNLTDLAQHDCLVGTSDTWLFADADGESAIKVSGRWRSNSGQAVLDAALRGLGVCQLPDYYVLQPIQNGELVVLLPENQPRNTGVWAVYPQRRQLSFKLRLIVDRLRQRLSERQEYNPHFPT